MASFAGPPFTNGTVVTRRVGRVGAVREGAYQLGLAVAFHARYSVDLPGMDLETHILEVSMPSALTKPSLSTLSTVRPSGKRGLSTLRITGFPTMSSAMSGFVASAPVQSPDDLAPADDGDAVGDVQDFVELVGL